jgi:beta-hydroxyacyl-[acyl carrier protein] dehydratase FabZ
MTPSTQNTANDPLKIADIMRFLPHRYPFLLVDRITSLERFKYVEAYKCVSVNEPFFQGHFPGLPVMPGVLIVEAMAQAGAFLVCSTEEKDLFEANIFLFTGIENARFRKPVVPGDRLDLRCDLIRQKRQLWRMRGTAHVDGVLAAESELTAAIAPREGFL